MNDLVWQNLRYTLVSIGAGLLTTYGSKFFTADQAAQLSDGLVGAAIWLGAIGWGNFVKWRTRAVPAKVAARADVPTVSPVTGAVER